MITIKMHDGKWRIIITDETWEFDDKIGLMGIINQMVLMKDLYGRVEKSK